MRAMSNEPEGLVAIGSTQIRVPRIGVGAWAWGEKRYWGYEDGYGPPDVVDAFTASVDAGLTFFDTAEIYGHGESEKILGWMARKSGKKLVIATKFAPLAGRDGARSVAHALDVSLKRLGLPRVDLYQVHWPDSSMASIASLMSAMADAVDAGRALAVGVSNFSAHETREAHAALAARGVALASNQVHYSLLHRAPEVDGVLDVCGELGITLLAYSPLEQGLLTGKYVPGGPLPPGPRADEPWFSPENIEAAQPVVALLREIGSAHGDRLPEQVALAWLCAKNRVLPIPGAKTGEQAIRNAGALDLVLTEGEVSALDAATEAWRCE